MLSDQLIRLIERQADRLEKQWEGMIRSHPATPSYQHLNDKALAGRIHEVYQHLGDCLEDSQNAENLAHLFMEIGARRKHQNIPLHEIIFTIVLARRNIWNFIMEEGPFTSTLQWHQVNECWDRIMKFFDKNMYFVVLGYDQGLGDKRKGKDVVSSLLHSFSMGVLPEVEKRS